MPVPSQGVSSRRTSGQGRYYLLPQWTGRSRYRLRTKLIWYTILNHGPDGGLGTVSPNMATGIEIWHYFQILQILQISMTGRKGLAGNSLAKARPGTDTQENNTACVK